MSKKSSDSLPIIIILGLAALTFLGKVIFDNLVYTWLMRELQHRFGLQEATVIAGFAAVALRLLAAMVVVGGLYLYLQREFEQRFVAATPTAPTSSEAELSEAKRKMMKEERAARREEFERARQSQSVPDWPIHELFSHRGPDLFDRPDEALWDAIGNDLRDALSLGRLRILGETDDRRHCEDCLATVPQCGLSSPNTGSWRTSRMLFLMRRLAELHTLGLRRTPNCRSTLTCNSTAPKHCQSGLTVCLRVRQT